MGKLYDDLLDGFEEIANIHNNVELAETVKSLKEKERKKKMALLDSTPEMVDEINKEVKQKLHKKLNKVLICGGRHFNNYKLLEEGVDNILKLFTLDENLEIVSGHAEGTDTLGEMYAQNHNYSLKTFPADWKKYGRSAGPIRNKQMIDYIKEYNSLLIAFVSDNTKGTKNTISLAKKDNIPVFEIRYKIVDGVAEKEDTLNVKELVTKMYKEHEWLMKKLGN